MADDQDTAVAEPWDGYDDASAEELIDAAGRKRSAEKLQEAIEYESAGKDRVTVIEAFEARVDALNDEPVGADVHPADSDEWATEGQFVPDSAELEGGQDTSKRKTSGQIAAQEDQERIEQREETNEKAAKAETEGGVTPTPVAPVRPVYAAENRQDRVELAGHQYRVSDDVEPDPAYVFDTQAAIDSPLVDHVAMASSASGFYLEIDGKPFHFDRDLSLALAQFARASLVALHY
jgi:hypothetical protein